MRAGLALLALPLAINAASLSEFTPYAEDLPSNCDKVYRSTINGCTDSDFESRVCSKACWLGLNQITIQVVKSCMNQGIKGHNIIVAFLSGTGPSQLCPKVSDNNSNQASSSQSQQSSSSSAQSTSSIPSTSSRSSATQISTSSSTSASTTATPSSTTQFANTVTQTTTSSSTASSTSSASGNSASQADLSHGGSPFDISGNLQSNAGRVSYSSLATLAMSFMVPYLAFGLL